jgi:hypothetical protein
VRRLYFSLTANRRLADLRPTDEEFNAIDLQLATLAKNPALGFEFPFQNQPRKHLRFDVGRFGFIYTYDKDEINVLTVF